MNIIKVLLLILIIPLFLILIVEEMWILKKVNIYSTVIEDRNNQFLLSAYKTNFTDDASEINDFIKLIFIGTIDKEFYEHIGLSLNKKTIHQRYAEIVLNRNDDFFNIKEGLLALALNNKYDKESVLDAYLNNAYFKNNVYGIKNASRYYFNKELSMISDIEAVYLLTIHQSNNQQPLNQLKELNELKDTIISDLYSNHFITNNDLEYFLSNDILFSINNSYLEKNDYIALLKKEINDKKINLEHITKITTSIDFNIISYLEAYQNSEIDIAIVKPFSGEILGLIDNNLPYNRKDLFAFLHYLDIEKKKNSSKALLSILHKRDLPSSSLTRILRKFSLDEKDDLSIIQIKDMYLSLASGGISYDDTLIKEFLMSNNNLYIGKNEYKPVLNKDYSYIVSSLLRYYPKNTNSNYSFYMSTSNDYDFLVCYNESVLVIIKALNTFLNVIEIKDDIIQLFEMNNESKWFTIPESLKEKEISILNGKYNILEKKTIMDYLF